MKIAVIEDSPTMRSVWSELLSTTDHEHALFGSSLEELEALLPTFEPDIVLARGLPRHQTLSQLVRWLRNHDTLRSARLLVATSFDEKSNYDTLDRVLIDRFLLMPFNKAGLDAVLAGLTAQIKRERRTDPLCLIVDDSSTVRSVLEAEVRALGFKVITANNGIEGLDSIKRDQPDIAIVDNEMPLKSGLELCQEVTRDPSTAHIPIVIMSASNDEGLALLGFSVGAVEMVPKPLSPKRLGELLEIAHKPSQNLRARALLLENNEATAALMTKLLARLDVDSTVCRRAEDFEAYLSIYVPDLICVDLSIPDGDGFEICKKLRQSRLFDAIPVVVVSEEAQRETMVECLQLGVNDYLMKPFVKNELIARMRNLLKVKRLRDELDQKNRQLEKLAYQDPTTGLLNREAFNDALTKESNRALRNGEKMALLLINLDHQKKIAEEYGYLIQEQLLKDVAGLLRHNIRDYDLPFRFSDDEMCVLLHQSGIEEAVRIADRIRTFCARHRFTDRRIVQTLSIGVTACPDPSTPKSLVMDADNALTRARTSGGNLTCAFELKSHSSRAHER